MTVTSSAFERTTSPRHVRVTGRMPMFGYERCADDDCVVGRDGFATSCGRPACPSCGSGGTNLTQGLLTERAGTWIEHMQCTCGHSWDVAFDGSPPSTDNHR